MNMVYINPKAKVKSIIKNFGINKILKHETK